MGIEDEIRELLLQGNPPRDLIQRGYKKSTIYKVYNSLTTNSVPISQSTWLVEGITFSRGRFLPGEIAQVSFELRNNSPADLYVYRTGVQPEWLYQENTWYPQELRILVAPGERKKISVSFPIPALALGEYEMVFGLEGQFLPPNLRFVPTVNSPLWTTPATIEIKYPVSCQVFISHSVQNLSLVRQLQEYLDNFGVAGIIAEDISQPGAILEDKFERMIKESNYFLGLLTYEALQSERVTKEHNYAFKIQKPMILLKEEGVNVESPVEWVSFSRHDPIEVSAARVFEAIEKIQQRAKDQSLPRPSSPPPALAVGILAFLAGLALGWDKGKRRQKTS
ncbi:MAG: toll/interleukin-1 receptor domain-containing protein [Dehalococcoidia bacterium]|nr:toll/interleukin-1 receptor domain-containing protein [Dehalococcoidia bacterium]